jgi:hypothetical protein
MMLSSGLFVKVIPSGGGGLNGMLRSRPIFGFTEATSKRGPVSCRDRVHHGPCHHRDSRDDEDS